MANMLEQAWILFISYSAFPTFCSLLFSLALWGQPIRVNLKRTVAAALLFSIYTSVSVQMIPTVFHIFNAMFAMVLMFGVFFRSIPFWAKVRIFVTHYFFAIMSEGLFGGLATLFYGREASLENPWMGIMFMWPPSLLYAGLALLLRRKNLNPGGSVLAFLGKKRNKELGLLLLFIFIQFIVCILGASAVVGDGVYVPRLLPYTAFVASGMSIVTILLVLRWMAASREEAVKSAQDLYIGDMDRLFTTVRGQRHDFLNHVTVIQGFLKLKKYEQLESYTKELVGEISEMNELVRIGHPALSALIQSKLMRAEAAKIKMACSFSGMERITLGAKSVDIVKIMGNLIDNAMDEVMNLEPQDRWLEVTGSVTGGMVSLSTRNPGRIISEKERSLLFQHGYSTKRDGKHSGVGLSVVKERVDYYQGVLEVESGAEQGTVFTVRLPVDDWNSSYKDHTAVRSIFL